MELKRVAEFESGGLDPVEDHVHGAEQVAEGLELDAVEGGVLELLEVFAAHPGGGFLDVVGGLGAEAGAAEAGVVDAVGETGADDVDHGADDVAGGVEFSGVAR